MVAARVIFVRGAGAFGAFAPGVSVLKSLKGLDPGMMDAFRSHCRQNYAGEYELLFGVASLSDPAARRWNSCRPSFPSGRSGWWSVPERLGTNGKVSTLAQLAGHARLRFPADQRFSTLRLSRATWSG
jgi:ceramide glucosyltransferase